MSEINERNRLLDRPIPTIIRERSIYLDEYAGRICDVVLTISERSGFVAWRQIYQVFADGRTSLLYQDEPGSERWASYRWQNYLTSKVLEDKQRASDRRARAAAFDGQQELS